LAEKDFATEVMDICNGVAEMLIEKNRKYGDSALSPKRVFSKMSAVETIKVRLDDKISRINSAQSDEDEDPYWDMMGYLVLLRIAKQREELARMTYMEPSSSTQKKDDFANHKGYHIAKSHCDNNSYVIINSVGKYCATTSEWTSLISEAYTFACIEDAVAAINTWPFFTWPFFTPRT
jgi:hypothetical protein